MNVIGFLKDTPPDAIMSTFTNREYFDRFMFISYIVMGINCVCRNIVTDNNSIVYELSLIGDYDIEMIKNYILRSVGVIAVYKKGYPVRVDYKDGILYIIVDL